MTPQLETPLDTPVSVRSPLPFNPSGIPDELKKTAQFVMWKDEPFTKRDGTLGTTKVPCSPHNIGSKASVKDPATWGTFEKCLGIYNTMPENYAGLGFVFTANDPFVFVDLDHVLDLGMHNDQIGEIVKRAHSWTETSQSGTGLHIIVQGVVPGTRCRNTAAGFEIYSKERFVALTGHRYQGTRTEVAANQDFLDWFYSEHIAADEVQPGAAPTGKAWRVEAVVGVHAGIWGVSARSAALTDDQLLEKARNQSGGKGEEFCELFDGERESNSEAQMSLANHLAWWCGADPDRILRIFLRSRLWENYPDKEKWYRTLTTQTIPEAISAISARGWYGDGSQPGAVGVHADAVTVAAAPRDAALDARLAGCHPSDLGNAERLLARYGNDLRYSQRTGMWYVWNGSVWERQIGVGTVAPLAVATVRAIYREAETIPPEMIPHPSKADVEIDKNAEARTGLRGHALKSEAKPFIDRMIGSVPSLGAEYGIMVEPSDFDQKKMMLAVENVTLDVENWKIFPHSREHLLTTSMPVVYDQSARAPRWKEFVEKILPDPDVRQFVQKFLGYSLTGLTGEQAFLFLHGSGANGKGVLLDVLEGLFGSQHARIRSEVIMSTGGAGTGEARFGLAPIQGKRLVTFGELEARSVFNEARLKELTGEDILEIEQKNRMAFNYRHSAKFILAGNHKPTIRGTDDGVWRRVRLVPFTVTIPVEERDPDLRSKLLAESSGILNWLLAGLRLYQSEGLTPPAAVVAATNDYKDDSDTLGVFLSECCNVGDTETCTGGSLYAAYKLFMSATEQEKFLLSAISFSKYLVERNFNKKKREDGVHWYGLSVKRDVLDDLLDSSAAAEVSTRRRYTGG